MNSSRPFAMSMKKAHDPTLLPVFGIHGCRTDFAPRETPRRSRGASMKGVSPPGHPASAGLYVARSKNVISVLIVDNDPLVREGWRALLERADDIQVVSEGRDGQEAIELATRFDPDIILMDIRMPRMNGLQATGRIVSKEAKTRVVIVTMYDEESLLQQALKQGASGFIAKTDSFGELITAVHAVHNGQKYLSRTISPLAAGGGAN